MTTPFLELHPECNSAETAAGNCFDISQAFLKHIHATVDKQDAEIIMVEGFLGDITKTTWRRQHPLTLHHSLVRWGALYYDWTARQFDQTHDVPRVLIREDLEKEWALIRKYC